MLPSTATLFNAMSQSSFVLRRKRLSLSSSSKRAETSGSGDDKSALPEVLLRLVDLGLFAVVALAPLIMGGRHPVGRLVLCSLVALIASAWCIRQALIGVSRWRRCGAEVLLLAAIVLVVVQLVPVTSSLRTALSPSTSELLPLWSGDGAVALGSWETLSLTPVQTKTGLSMLLAYAMLFLVVVQRIDSTADVERILRWIALSAVAMAVIGLAQYLVGNGKFLWVHQDPARDTTGVVKGAFFNQNHFVHFLALGIGPVILWLHQTTKSNKERKQFRLKEGSNYSTRRLYRLLPGIVLGLVAFAGLLSFSRGGVAALLVAAVVTVVMFARSSLLGSKSLLALGSVGIVLVLALLIHGHTKLSRELGKVNYESVDDFSQQETRSKIWRANLAGIRCFGLVGTGIGSHRFVLPTYLDTSARADYQYAENGYLQVALESGLPGAVLLCAGIGLVFCWCRRAYVRSDSSRVKAGVAAITGGLVASVVHSLVDFVWYIPACISLTVILAACACRLDQLSKTAKSCSKTNPTPERGHRNAATDRAPSILSPRATWAAASCAISAVGVMMVGTLLPAARASTHWEDFEKATFSNKELDGQDNEAAYSLEWLSDHVSATLKHNPDSGLANLHMASLCLGQFEVAQQESANPMPLSQIRQAVQVSEFRSADARERWLSVAVGDNLAYLQRSLYHARRAIELCPLHGDAYIFLAELSFLDGGDDSTARTYVDQALRVRPHSGRVLVAAGINAALSGNEQEAWQRWKKAFHLDRNQQLRLIQTLAPQYAPSFLIETFEPDLAATQHLYAYYRSADLQEESKAVAAHLAPMLETEAHRKTGERACSLWQEAAEVHHHLERGARALFCLRKAVEISPQNWGLRRRFAVQLVQEGEYANGAEHLRWCLSRKPNDKHLHRALAKVNLAIRDDSHGVVR